MKKLIIICVAGFFLCPTLFSQDILLKGKIVADSLNESAINIINNTRKKGTSNNASGDFQIVVSKNDTLLFSSVQYQLVEVVITNKILSDNYLKISLIDKINELEVVRISNINLSGNLEQDLRTMKIFSQAAIGIPFSAKPLPTLNERKISGARNSALELLINTLNGRIKMLKKAQKYMAFDAMVDQAVQAVPTAFYVENLKIPNEEIFNFVIFCTEDDHFRKVITQNDHLALLEIYYIKAPGFLKRLKEQNP